jgi:hypothetical protein
MPDRTLLRRRDAPAKPPSWTILNFEIIPVRLYRGSSYYKLPRLIYWELPSVRRTRFLSLSTRDRMSQYRIVVL